MSQFAPWNGVVQMAHVAPLHPPLQKHVQFPAIPEAEFAWPEQSSADVQLLVQLG